MEWMIILLIACAVVAALFIGIANTQNAVSSGMIIKRNRDFYDQKHIITSTCADVDYVWNHMDRSVLEKARVHSEYDAAQNRIEFTTSRSRMLIGGYLAALTQLRPDDQGRTRIRFEVEAYNARSFDVTAVNAILTLIEKTVYEADHEAVAERIYIKRKTS